MYSTSVRGKDAFVCSSYRKLNRGSYLERVDGGRRRRFLNMKMVEQKKHSVVDALLALHFCTPRGIMTVETDEESIGFETIRCSIQEQCPLTHDIITFVKRFAFSVRARKHVSTSYSAVPRYGKVHW